MTADEIERVVRASAAEATAKPGTAPARTEGPGFDKARLVATLAAQGMEAEGIEFLLHALAEFPNETAAKVEAIASLVGQGMEAQDIARVIRAFRSSPPTGTPRIAADTSFRE
jgi:hypothetical protein